MWESGVMTRGGGKGRDREEKVEGYDPLGSSLMLLLVGKYDYIQ